MKVYEGEKNEVDMRRVYSYVACWKIGMYLIYTTINLENKLTDALWIDFYDIAKYFKKMKTTFCYSIINKYNEKSWLLMKLFYENSISNQNIANNIELQGCYWTLINANCSMLLFGKTGK